MTEEKDANGGAWSRVPTWDGSPQTWRSFRKDMSWWLAGLDIESTKKYNLAARWLLRQSGMVRQRGEEFDPAELEYQREVRVPDPTTGDDTVVTPEDPLSGIKKLLAALETMTGRTSLDKRGELRQVFYLELRRRSGERISEFAIRFRTLVSELKAEGVVIADGELGWWFKHKLGLDALRSQLLETALAGAEDYPTIEREVLRLFKDLHVADPLRKKANDQDNRAPLLNRFLSQQSTASRPSSYAPSMASSAPRSFRSGTSSSSSGRFTAYRRPQPAKQAMVSEVEEEPEDLVEEAHEADDTGPQSLEEVMTTEAEVLAAELEEAAAQGLDEETLHEVEESVEAAAEAFLTMREARSKLQEVRKDRGYGKPSSPSANAPAASKVSLKKQSDKHPCFDCGLPGHWAGDPECQKPGQQLGRKKGKQPQKQVKVTEALNTEHGEPEAGHEVMVANRLHSNDLSEDFSLAFDMSHRPKEVNVVGGLSRDKRLVGALDSACNRTCTGPEWLSSFLTCLRASAPQAIVDLVKVEDEKETFRFGNGGTQVSLQRWRLPTVIGGVVLCFWTSVVQVPSLGLLLGRDFLEAVGGVMSFTRKVLTCDLLDGHPIRLSQLAAGHYSVGLIPERWPGLDTQRWRRLGLDGIVEVQMSPTRWLKKRFSSAPSFSQVVDGHDHFLTESSVRVGHLVCSVLADRSSLVQARMTRPSVRSPSRTTSSTTRTRTLTTAAQPSNGPELPSEQPAMAEARTPHERKVKLGKTRAAPVGVAKALLALSAIAVSLNGICGALGSPRPCPVHGQGHGKAPLRQGREEQWVQLREPAGDDPSPQPTGARGSLLRRPRGPRVQDGEGSKRVEPEGERSGHGRSQGEGQDRQGGGQPEGVGSCLDRAARRFAVSEGRFGQACSPAQCASGAKRHSRDHQGQDQAHDGGSERRAKAGSQRSWQGKGKEQGSQPELKRPSVAGLQHGFKPTADVYSTTKSHGPHRAVHGNESQVPDHFGPHGVGLPLHVTELSSVMTEPSLMTDEEMVEANESRQNRELMEDAARSLEQHWEAKLAAQFGEDFYLLTQEEMESVLDP